MAELNKISRCYRCGAILQTEDPLSEGYISPEIMNKYPRGLLLCNNCYKNEGFNEHPYLPSFDEDYKKILDKAVTNNDLIVYVIDLFSFEGSFISKLIEVIKDLDVIVVANKRDLLPKKADENELINYVHERLSLTGLSVKDIVLVSSNTDYNLDLMYEKIIKQAKNRNVYFLGASISGKSTLITELMKRIKNVSDMPISLEQFKGTSLQGYKIPISNKNFIFELPGTDIHNSLYSKVEPSVQRVITPKKAVVPQDGVLLKGGSIAIGGLAVIELFKGKTTLIKTYFAKGVELKFRQYSGLNHLKHILQKRNIVPCSNNFYNMNDFDAYDFIIDESGYRDIGISGLGWISFKGSNQTFRIYVPKGVYVYEGCRKVVNVK
ncbi:MAG: hypothetical protein IJ656_01165 [Bacilli bacterium]|nr:hypothetical protein [Bacilli bacterium]